MGDSTPLESDKTVDQNQTDNVEKNSKSNGEQADTNPEQEPALSKENIEPPKEPEAPATESTEDISDKEPTNRGTRKTIKESHDEKVSEAKTNQLTDETSQTQDTPMETSVDRVTRGKKRKLEDAKEVIEGETESQDSTNANESKDEDGSSKDKAEDQDADMNISNTEPMGKGKRARIPNKRYSDIVLASGGRKSVGHSSAPTNTTLPNEIEQKEVHAKEEVHIKEIKEEVASYVSEDVASISVKKTKAPSTSSVSDPKYLKPLDMGWKRELVWRATTSNTKRQGDIYYYTPTGKKVRSFREVSENLKGSNKKLTLDNFTFVKESLGINDPSKEIIRDAKFKVVGLPATPKPVSKGLPEKRTPIKSVMTPKLTTPSTPIIKTKIGQKTPITKNSKNMKSTKKTPKTEETPMEVEKPVVKSTPVRKAAKANLISTSENKPCQPCSIRCEGVQGLIPTLQCRLCLCLYHHQCVGLSPHLNLPYVCKNCHLEQSVSQTTTTTTMSAPPPLTPINTLKSVTSTHPTTLPKLQRIPKNPSDVPPVPPSPEMPVLPRLIPRPPQNVSPPVSEKNMPQLQKISPPLNPAVATVPEPQKSLVGGVTSWLPHNSKIVEEPTDIPRPQYLEILGGRKFLVIPKHNLMTISPNFGNNRTEDNLATVPETLAPSTSVPLDSASLGPSPQNSDSESKSAPKPTPVPEMSLEAETVEAMDVDPTEENGESSKGVKRPSIENDEHVTESAPSKPKSRNLKLSNITNSSSANPEERSETRFMENYLQNLSFGYNTLLYVFQYLKVQDLLRAGCVCTMWRDIASHPILWRTVRMKNSQVHSFEGLANTLKKHGTRHLDLRKMLLPNSGDEIWPEFSKAIARVDTLSKIELCRCPASVVEQLAESNPSLEVINAVTIRCESMNLDPLKSLRNIKELRLKSTSGLTVPSIDSLEYLITLQQLSLTSVNELHKLNLNVLEKLVNLKVLELGECVDFPKSFGENILGKLDNLEKLRLEKGQGNCHTFEILTAVKDMPNLEQLELVNFDVKNGFDKALGACSNIKKLMIIPTYISQSATTNNMVLSGVLRLQKSLTHFVWGVTLELLRVTELFVDQCEDPKEKKEKKPTGNGDSIPVLKPVPDLSNSTHIAQASNPPQVEILPLPNLQKLLLNSLPTTRVKILKIPFHATWRQTLTDSV